jgi:hypothetical protein
MKYGETPVLRLGWVLNPQTMAGSSFNHLCNTPGVCHSLSSGFELKHDRLNGDEPNLKLDVASLLYI